VNEFVPKRKAPAKNRGFFDFPDREPIYGVCDDVDGWLADRSALPLSWRAFLYAERFSFLLPVLRRLAFHKRILSELP
jgi:hypothetical protein